MARTEKLYRLQFAAAQTGVARTTLISAIERGELKHMTTGCGLPLVSLDDVRRWHANPNRPRRSDFEASV